MTSQIDSMAWLPTDTTPLLEASLAYAEHGFRVLPVWWARADGTCACKRPDCENEGKHPIAKAWQRQASSEESAVRDARRSRGDANVGIAMGGSTRLIAIDIDGADGRASWEALEAEAGSPAPDTLSSRSGRVDGGEHRIYRVPDSFDWRRVRNRVAMRRGVDVRADGGQIVVAPSRHKSGARYTWSRRVPVAEAPAWLCELIAATPDDRPKASNDVGKRDSAQTTYTNGSSSYLTAVVTNACAEIASKGKGERNVVLFAKACTVFDYHVGMRVDPADARHALEQAARTCGLTPSEITAALDSAWNKVKGGMGKAPPERGGNQSSAELPTSEATSRPTDDVAGAAAPPGAPSSPPRLSLDVDGEGRPRKTLANVAKVLSADSRWAGIIAYDLFAESIRKTRPAPVRDTEEARETSLVGLWSDEDTIRTSIWLSHVHGIEVQSAIIDQAVAVVARRNEVHPVRDYLAGVTWDGTPRLDTWLVAYYGAEDTEYTRGIGARWAISAVARVMQPGCQADCALVLETPRQQGRGKSTGIEALVGREWFTDSLPAIGDKDSYQTLRGKWVIEMGELAALKGRDRDRVKNFLSARSDSYRPSYGRRVRDFLRQCVFAGSTNEDEYFDDPTGNRRFWPVLVGEADRAAISRDRDQLWAEAVHRFQAGEPWHVNTPEFRALCEAEQRERQIDDPWTSIVAQWLEKPTIEEWDAGIGATRVRTLDIREGVLVSDVIRGALKKLPGHITKADQMRVSEALRGCGYERGPLLRLGTGRVRRFVKLPAQIAVAPRLLGEVRPVGATGDKASASGTLGAVVAPVAPQSVHDNASGPGGAGRTVTASKQGSYESSVQLQSALGCDASLSLSNTQTGVTSETREGMGTDSLGYYRSHLVVAPVEDGQGATRQGASFELPDDFFGVDVDAEPALSLEDGPAEATDVAPTCTCMAGPGEAHEAWCGEESGT